MLCAPRDGIRAEEREPDSLAGVVFGRCRISQGTLWMACLLLILTAVRECRFLLGEFVELRWGRIPEYNRSRAHESFNDYGHALLELC